MSDQRPLLRIVLATANAGKTAEIEAILEAELGSLVHLEPRPAGLGEIEETGETLEENARLKAAAVAAEAGLPAIADDTGLEVEALDGAPGVHSARYSGPEATYASNVAKLLESLDGVTERAAVFRTVAIVCWPDGRELVADGLVRGRIAERAAGEGGFGYDPVFVPDECGGRSFAELTLEEKNDVSHRGRAFRALAGRLRSSIGP